MKNELQILSKQVKKEADLLLKKTRLIEQLSKYGNVHKRGSYELDLMVDGDIDIYVIDNQFSNELTNSFYLNFTNIRFAILSLIINIVHICRIAVQDIGVDADSIDIVLDAAQIRGG